MRRRKGTPTSIIRVLLTRHSEIDCVVGCASHHPLTSSRSRWPIGYALKLDAATAKRIGRILEHTMRIDATHRSTPRSMRSKVDDPGERAGSIEAMKPLLDPCRAYVGRNLTERVAT